MRLDAIRQYAVRLGATRLDAAVLQAAVRLRAAVLDAVRLHATRLDAITPYMHKLDTQHIAEHIFLMPLSAWTRKANCTLYLKRLQEPCAAPVLIQ